MPDKETTIDLQGDLEALFVNNTALSALEGYLNHFNPIRVMKMERMEIRHSAILAWLCTPSETHGLGDSFLKAFLSEALRGTKSESGITALDVFRADLRAAEVRCEWQNIDIFVYCPQQGWAFIIENKYHAKQGKTQLEGYFTKVEKIYRPRNVALVTRGVFLTLNEEAPADARFTSVRYREVCKLLRQTLDGERHQLTEAVKTFLSHYLAVIEEAAGMSKDQAKMIELARALYRDHRRALDFIMEHGAVTDFGLATNLLFGDAPDELSKHTIEGVPLIYGGAGSANVSFLPESWWAAMGPKNRRPELTEDWWMNYPVIAWLEVLKPGEDGKAPVRLMAEVGPMADKAKRRALIAAIDELGQSGRSENIRFTKSALNGEGRYSRFLKNNASPSVDAQDSDEIAKAMSGLVAKFADDFRLVAEVLAAQEWNTATPSAKAEEGA